MPQRMDRRQFLRTFATSAIVLLGAACAATGAGTARAQATPASRLPSPAKRAARAGILSPEIRQTKPGLTIGTLGHVDHGKTTLTAAITKVQALQSLADFSPYEHVNDAPEERIRGVTISIKRVKYQTAPRAYTQIDCPGHADYVKAMIAGAARLDGAILVVSAPDGPMPQTREHILLARQLDVPAIVVYLNKLDLMDDRELLDLVELEVRELLSKYGFSGQDVQVVRGSALPALTSYSQSASAPEFKSIIELLQALDSSIPSPTPLADRPFLMPISDVRPIAGRGSVAIGRIERGQVRAGDTVELIGFTETRSTTVIGIEAFGRDINVGMPGDEVGCFLKGIDRNELERGQVLAQPGSITARRRFGAEVYLLSREEGGREFPIQHGFTAVSYLNGTDVTGRLELPTGLEMMKTGEHRSIGITLIAPVALERGMQFAIREEGRTIGVGVVTDLFA